MDSLVQRWRNAVRSSEKKTQIHTEQNRPEQTEISIRQSKVSVKSKGKTTKRQKHRQEKSEGERIQSQKHQTPSKSRSLKAIVIDDFADKIDKLTSETPARRTKLRCLLQQLWQVAQDNTPVASHPQPPTPKDTPSKIQNKVYSDLESRYFECEKEKHYLKSTLEATRKKYENIEHELERLYKVEKLVDGTVTRERVLMDEVEGMRRELRVAQEREQEQQRIFKKEVFVIHSLIETLKGALPK